MMRGLVGRDAELADVRARAVRHRLVTVVGPGGVGKTALVRAAADQLADRFPLGVRHVDLTQVDDARVVAGAIANQLGFDSFDALLSSPNDRPVLLVVDNCEHLLDAVADALTQVLGACHQPTALATSRSPLELPGESIVTLAPLGVPRDHDDPTACASVQLFLERCAQAGANVGPSDMASVVELCQQLDGLPLAIEIAAARSRSLSVAEITTRLRHSVDVLQRPRFRGDPRHRSVADTIRWSYDLLSPPAAELLDHLSVFSGPFTAASAAAVARTEQRPTLDTDLEELVSASLVSVDTSGPETRYRLLDTVRRFARARLHEHRGVEAAHDRFVDHVLARVREIIAGGGTTWRPTIAADLLAAFDDVSSALRWCLEHDSEPKRPVRLCSVLWSVVHQGHTDEVLQLAGRTLERWPDEGTPATAQISAVMATAEYVTGHADQALERATAALARLNDRCLAAVTLHRVLGQSQRALGDGDGAIAAFRAGAALGHELGMTANALELEVAAAVVTADLGRVADSIDELRSVIDRATEVDSPLTTCWARSVLGWVLLRHNPAEALIEVEAALTQARALDYGIGVSVGLRSRAFAHLLDDEPAGARETVTELYHELIRRGALSNGRLLVDVTAALAYRCDHPVWEPLAATARALPITTLPSSQFELIPLPDTIVPPRTRFESFGLVWQALAELESVQVTEEPPLEAPDVAPDAAPSLAPAVAPSAVSGGSIRQLGEVCEFTYAGRTATLRTTKGVADLVQLIDADGREMHCLDLAKAAVEESSTGEVIDAAARRNYEERIRDLQAEIDEAEQHSDYARAYKYQTELDALIEHLTAALGKRGRTRRGADSAERARSAVTHRIRTTIRQIERVHPVLGRHLAHSVKTGLFCSYQPEQATHWTVDQGVGVTT